MRTADQIKRKYHELTVRKDALQARIGSAAADEAASLAAQLERLDEQLQLLEWVLNEPQGSYHVHP